MEFVKLEIRVFSFDEEYGISSLKTTPKEHSHRSIRSLNPE
jgi:hypothetical protein